MGRIQRTQTDRGVAVILDNRAMSLKRYLGPLEETVGPSDIIKDFFLRGPSPSDPAEGFVTAENLYNPPDE